MIYHWGWAWVSMHCWFNVSSCRQTTDNHSISKKLHAAISPVKEAITATHTHGLNFTIKLWPESLVLMSVDYGWPLPEVNSTTVHDLTVPSLSNLPLSWSAVAMHVLTWVVFAQTSLHQSCTQAGSLTPTAGHIAQSVVLSPNPTISRGEMIWWTKLNFLR